MATILERELETAIKEWLPRVRLLPALIRIPISDEDRMLPLPRLFRDVACRVRLAEGEHLPRLHCRH